MPSTQAVSPAAGSVALSLTAEVVEDAAARRREPAGLVESMSADDVMPSDAQVQAAAEGRATHPREPHTGGTAGRLNWLRAAVLGANDGIVSVAGIVIGVAGATTNRGPIFTAGLAGLVAGAVSMALGEYVSVSSQRDSERAQMAHRLPSSLF